MVAGTTSSSSASKASIPPAVPSKPSVIPTKSAAPALDDFTPPEPTSSDPYPGYYQLPSGGWAQYDTAYYQSFYKKWQKDYEKYIRNLEKGKLEKGFEDLDRVGISGEVDPVAEMEKAKVHVKELEERKQLTHGAGSGPEAPRMNVQGAKLGGRARSRHQLTTLLTEAYQNRESLEEQIAQGRRNRKEAGMKYGESFRYLWWSTMLIHTMFRILMSVIAILHIIYHTSSMLHCNLYALYTCTILRQRSTRNHAASSRIRQPCGQVIVNYSQLQL